MLCVWLRVEVSAVAMTCHWWCVFLTSCYSPYLHTYNIETWPVVPLSATSSSALLWTPRCVSYLTLWRPLLPHGYSRKGWASECPDVINYKWRLNPVWHRMLYSCSSMATVGVKGLTPSLHSHSSFLVSSFSLLSAAARAAAALSWHCNTRDVCVCVTVLLIHSPSATLLTCRKLHNYTYNDRVVLVLVWCKSIHVLRRYAHEKRFLHFHSQWPWPLTFWSWNYFSIRWCNW